MCYLLHKFVEGLNTNSTRSAWASVRHFGWELLVWYRQGPRIKAREREDGKILGKFPLFLPEKEHL